MKIETYLVKTKLHTTTLLFSSINSSVTTMISRNFCQKSSNNVLKGQKLFVKYVVFSQCIVYYYATLRQYSQNRFIPSNSRLHMIDVESSP